MSNLLMGIDNGSQSTKVAIFDENGHEICHGSYALQPTQTPKPGMVFHPDDDLWVSILGGMEACLQNFKGNRKDIVAIGLCTIRCCRVLLDAECELAEPAISWMDVRLSKPYVHTDDRVKYVTTTSGYLAYRMTGQKKDTCGNQEVWWPMDWPTLEWGDDKLMQEMGLKREMLFDLVKPGEAFGPLKPEFVQRFGLREGIPVVATANDKAVEVLGAGLKSEDEVMISLGTFISAMMYRHEYFDNAQNFFPTLACEPFKYVYECNGIRRGMWTVSWFKQIAGLDVSIEAKERGVSEEQVLNEHVKDVPPGSDGLLTVLDWLSPPSNPYRKGIMIGFDQRHTKSHMYRSILEAIAYTIKINVDLMTDETKTTLKHIVVIGGGSQSNVLMQIIADLFGMEVKRLKASSSACLGAAICAAMGVGLVKSFDEAKSKTIETKEVFQPNTDNHKLYTRINEEVYKGIREYTDPLLTKSYPIFS